eukprot:SAG11_NODE_18514_length_488_cov_88.655527_1_plen_56_part_00
MGEALKELIKKIEEMYDGDEEEQVGFHDFLDKIISELLEIKAAIPEGDTFLNHSQ